MKYLIAVAVGTLMLTAQTRINLRQQSRDVDFTSAGYTKPVRTVTALPAICSQHEMVMLSSAPATGRLFICAEDNTWVQQKTDSGLSATPDNSGKLLSSDGNTLQWQALGGDAAGSPSQITVTAIRNQPVAAAAPSSGQVLRWNAAAGQWEPQSSSDLPALTGSTGKFLSNNGTAAQWMNAGGDVSGGPAALRITGIQGRPVATTAPSDRQTLTWNASATRWEPRSTDLPPVFGDSGKFLSNDGSLPAWREVAGDVAGGPSAMKVTGLQSRAVGELAPAHGQVLMWNELNGQWEPQSTSAGSITVEANGTAVGTRPTQNFIAGFGLTNLLADDGTAITITHNVNTAVLQTHAAAQSGAALLCESLATSGSAYTCATTPMLIGYTRGMLLRWIPDVDTTGPATLNIDSLGAAPVKLSDAGDPAAEIKAGRLYEIWYDGSAFRLVSESAPVTRTAAPLPVCDAAARGKLWHVFGGDGVKDGVAVCAKDAGDIYDWRVIY